MLLPSFSKTIHDWFYKNGTSSVCSQRHNIPWCVLFSLGIWCLGLHRNNIVFQAEGSNIRLHNECSKKYECSGILLSFLSSFPRSQPHKQRFQLNGASHKGLVSTQFRQGFFRESQPSRWGRSYWQLRSWMGPGFLQSHWHDVSVIAQLWVLHDGLIMAKEIGVEKLWVVMDAQEVVNLVANRGSPERLIQSFLMEYRLFSKLSKNPNWSIISGKPMELLMTLPRRIVNKFKTF